MLIDHNPQVPNRQRALRGEGGDPGAVIREMGLRIESAGADFLVIPCNTAHLFIESLVESVSIPLLSIIDVTVNTCSEFSTVAILAADGCLASGLYQEAFLARDIGAVLPNEDEQMEIMDLIRRVKAGDTSDSVQQAMQRLANQVASRGAEAVVAACTEIPLVLHAEGLDVPLVNSTDCLAKAAIAEAIR